MIERPAGLSFDGIRGYIFENVRLIDNIRADWSCARSSNKGRRGWMGSVMVLPVLGSAPEVQWLGVGWLQTVSQCTNNKTQYELTRRGVIEYPYLPRRQGSTTASSYLPPTPTL